MIPAVVLAVTVVVVTVVVVAVAVVTVVVVTVVASGVISEHFTNPLRQVSSPSNIRQNGPMEPSALTLMHGPIPTLHKSSLQNVSG